MLKYSEVIGEAYSIILLLHANKHCLPMNDGYGEFASNYHFQILRYESDYRGVVYLQYNNNNN